MRKKPEAASGGCDRAFLRGEGQTLPLSKRDSQVQVAKMYPNSLFRPGGSESRLLAILPYMSFDTVMGSSYGPSVYVGLGKYSITPSILSTQEWGTGYGLIVRRSLYESPSRDTNIDVFAFGHTWEKGMYWTDEYGMVRDREVINEGVDYGAGVGMTRRFFYPSVGVSAELIGEQQTSDDAFKPKASLFGFYDVFKEADVFAGLLRNDPVVGFSLMWARLGWDIRNGNFKFYLMNISY